MVDDIFCGEGGKTYLCHQKRNPRIVRGYNINHKVMDLLEILKNFPTPKNNEQYKGLILLGGFIAFVTAWSTWSFPEGSKQGDTVE